MVEGMLNGIGFVIGSALVAWIFLHGSAILAFLILVIVLWLIFRNVKHLKARLATAKIDEFTHAIRSSFDARVISSRDPDQGTRKADPQGEKAKKHKANP